MSLGPTSRNLVTAARTGLGPAPDVAARVRARVALAVGGATSIASTPAGRASVVSSGRLVALLAASAVVVTTWFVVHRSSAPAVPPAISAPTATVSDEPQVEPHFTSAVQAEAAPSIPTPISAAVAAPIPMVIEAPVPATLAREVALLDAAMTSLHANDPAATLDTLATYDRETLGHGQLAEDALALEIEAR
ncbi:MAG: hypothetical protein ABI591_18200, partial [Kofleriaceae bacterium]